MRWWAAAPSTSFGISRHPKWRKVSKAISSWSYHSDLQIWQNRQPSGKWGGAFDWRTKTRTISRNALTGMPGHRAGFTALVRLPAIAPVWNVNVPLWRLFFSALSALLVGFLADTKCMGWHRCSLWVSSNSVLARSSSRNNALGIVNRSLYA